MISVLMSVYNEKMQWIKDSIDSIQKQTYRDFEFIIIIDNPNIDKDISLYLDRIESQDTRIKIVWNEKNMGLAKSLNKGIGLAKGEYVARMDADDISVANRFEKQLDFITKNDFDLISAYKINIDENGKRIGQDSIDNKNPNLVLPYTNIIVHPLVFVKRELLIKLNGYREFYNSEDLDLWLRMISSGCKLGMMKEYLLYYRIRSNSASIDRQLEQYYCNQYIIRLYNQRKKYGIDNFSHENLDKFLKNKRITESRKKRFQLANTFLEKGLVLMANRNITFILFVVKAFILCPKYVVRRIQCFLLSKLAARM